MPAHIIAVANQKGGAGKTTVAMCLAGTLGRRGRKVLVVDADPQGTASKWAGNADEDAPFPADLSGLAAVGDKIHREVRKFVDAYEFIIVDCPPAVDAVTPRSALLIADLVIIPTIPSPADFWAIDGIKKLLEMVRTVNEGIAARVLRNSVQGRTNIGEVVTAELQEIGIPLMSTQFGRRAAFQSAVLLGATPHALGKEARAAADECDSLADEVEAFFATVGQKVPDLEVING
jgi:chromosome partitioning protein